MNSWAVALMVQMSRMEYLRLGKRPATLSDYQALLTWAQELNGWTVIVG